MKSQIFFFQFDTKTKPGKIIATGIRFETQEFDGTMGDAKIPLLCAPNALENGISKAILKALKTSVAKNI